MLPASTPTAKALNLLIEVHGHCLLVTEEGKALGLINLADLQRGLQRQQEQGISPLTSLHTLKDCLRTELVWLPETASLCQLEDQLLPGGLRQLPVFAVPSQGEAFLPQGLPRGGLPEARLLGLASRDGLARAVARHLQLMGSCEAEIRASATGSA